MIEFVPRVGDFISTGEPLFRLYGGAAAIDDRKLRAAVAFGPERTMIENLRHTLPEHRHPALRNELDLLNCQIGRCFTFPEDLELACKPDT